MKQKESVKSEHPELYDYFNTLPLSHGPISVYFACGLLLVACCLKPEHSHPVRNSQAVSVLPTWYDGDLSVSIIPLPIPNPNRPWGGAHCKQCNGTCYGHFLKPPGAISSSLPPMDVPPSALLKKAFDELMHCSYLIRSECASNIYIR